MSIPERSLHDGDSHGALDYAEMLRRAGGPVPEEHVDWEAFHKRLGARAELPLARLRLPRLAPTTPARPVSPRTHARPVRRAWWEHAARWSRRIVSVSVAAGIALVAVVRTSPKDTVDTVVATVATADQGDGTRAAFESAALGHTASWTIDSGVLPTATDLLIPLGARGRSP